MFVPNIKANRKINAATVRAACIRNDLYTCGDNEEYGKMLDMADLLYPNNENLYVIAKDICDHSKCQTITNVMFILEREAVITTFEIEGEDEI